MIIYGVALLAICTLAGVILGDMLGVLLGVKSNVGGVGIAMILLICARLWMQKRGGGGMTKECEMGVGFWGAMYIPVVVAMAAQQNVVAALHGGPVAILAAVASVLVCGCVIAFISRINKGEPLPAEEPLETLPASPVVTTAGGR
ncbi:malonate transporter subunit MadL [Pseudomonas sp. 10B1]|uniref:malonate transporter subunit MadL n=1 Tax=unclassified Pseudomonas TaxID=196821 RepID=UPI002AB4E2AC|nr:MULTISPECIES: malonate transporter subunit MadL [unclassified Pseudomonas]MDY7562824.1 malonate transporter subunit MadL [Pseudomonas sp. AB6]MEA9978692.1 malonate transporter subunit MadL [Pseudomonas sp. RTS4]MEA9994377.1 malonate transporter subunit MadL [Pseudomonas sp. AA4]MEB0087795.1 malonate transporter subunit MadL [Pseudomonas sp. RTI1]MEB0126631.1 malonate transporter subunit MadL [Pseudomonas sp. CCC1.2]